ncbi:hypothetical protein [Methylobacterium brachythecii]|uniref:Uncharacterized protein n=1 Tax=Methylobacterium brachythecii TaxID=1176177 RepID=A0A7W6F5H6_9HYPH|nr:hypothetical protein [Methylobacterium brachythecii]MBB3901357.1 hypothetical protein [Methylobacterium brachythecii]GLS42932.1 hypothetical protein GCM10007884_09170 [Methylobacterium brachythecii]
MTTTDHPATGGGTIAFVASETLIEAIDTAAGAIGQTRSHYVRSRIADYLKSEGWLPIEAPSIQREVNRRTVKSTKTR